MNEQDKIEAYIAEIADDTAESIKAMFDNLQSRLDAKSAEAKLLGGRVLELERENVDLIKNDETKSAALVEFGRHLPGCYKFDRQNHTLTQMINGVDCDCGFDAAKEK